MLLQCTMKTSKTVFWSFCIAHNMKPESRSTNSLPRRLESLVAGQSSWSTRGTISHRLWGAHRCEGQQSPIWAVASGRFMLVNASSAWSCRTWSWWQLVWEDDMSSGWAMLFEDVNGFPMVSEPSLGAEASEPKHHWTRTWERSGTGSNWRYLGRGHNQPSIR